MQKCQRITVGNLIFTAVAQWLRCWKVAGSIPAGVIGIFN